VNDSLVLCYHAISPTWTAALSVTQDGLERQLHALVSRGWAGATFSAAVLVPPSSRTLAVTFDDAFASVNELARPVLASLGLPATVFTPTHFVSAGGPLSWPGVSHWAQTQAAAELACMSWDELGELADTGWEIGSHTRTHPRLTTLDGERLTAELEGSREEVARNLGRPCTTIAYPYGDVDQRVADAASAAGYRTGAALSSRLERAGPLRFPRVGIYHGDSDWRFRLKASRPLRRLRGLPLWPTGR
jgi:peptidoglycan/xylan/chitin deacetylase (PgdA/CDA1 family)